jgi:hypothetical protein
MSLSSDAAPESQQPIFVLDIDTKLGSATFVLYPSESDLRMLKRQQ